MWKKGNILNAFSSEDMFSVCCYCAIAVVDVDVAVDDGGLMAWLVHWFLFCLYLKDLFLS